MPVISKYTEGTTVQSQVTFSVSGTNTDPTTVIVRIKDSQGSVSSFIYETDAEVVKSATGIFYINQLVDTPGEWTFRWEGTGTAVGAAEDTIVVNRSRVI